MEDKSDYTILAIDDAKDSLLLIEFDLVESGYNVITAESGEIALSIIEDSSIDLILLDLYMPGMSGMQVLKQLKAKDSLQHIPIIMLSASGDEEQIVAALEHGADDYVTKPYISNILQARIRNSLRLMEKTRQLEKLANTDFLTKVSNRGNFEFQVKKLINQAKRADEIVSLAMFDLDLFKNINDTYGHEAGDKALIDFASILIDTFRDYDVIGRIGGEEFAVCMPNTSVEKAFNACERCRKTLEKHQVKFTNNGETQYLSLTVSIGISSMIGAEINLEALLREADQGLYQSKEQGRNQSVITNDPTTLKVGENVNDNNEKYPGIDFSTGVNNVLGDEELFQDILVMFYQDHGKDHENIQEAIANNDIDKLKHLVHTLKGVVCSIGAMNLFKLCKALDEAVNEGRETEFQSLFSPVKEELVVVLSGLESSLKGKL